MEERAHTLDLLRQPGIPRSVFLAVAVAWGIGLIAGIWIDPLFVFLQVGVTAVIALFIYRPDLPLYLMAATYPFISWEVVRGGFNAPVVDIIATLAVIAWVVRQLWYMAIQKKLPRNVDLWGWGIFAAWIGVALISTTMTFDHMTSLKFVLRFLIFFYVAYIWLPLNDIVKPRQLAHILMILYLVGVAVSLYGLYGFFVSDAASFLSRRVVPTELFGLYPLGTNHNIIADIMITTIPIGFFLMQYYEAPQRQKILFIGIALMIGANLLTFSRTGWLALFLEMVLIIFLMYRHHIKIIIRYAIILSIIASPLLIYMLVFSSQENVQSSNYNRTILNEIAWTNFSEKPFFGQGPATFIPTVAHNQVYIEEFGGPLDAHGFIQKIGSELGIAGLSVFMALLFAIILRIYTTYKQFMYNDVSAYLLGSLLIMVVGDIFFQLFQTSYFVSKLWFPIGVALAAVAITRRELTSDQTKS